MVNEGWIRPHIYHRSERAAYALALLSGLAYILWIAFALSAVGGWVGDNPQPPIRFSSIAIFVLAPLGVAALPWGAWGALRLRRWRRAALDKPTIRALDALEMRPHAYDPCGRYRTPLAYAVTTTSTPGRSTAELIEFRMRGRHAWRFRVLERRDLSGVFDEDAAICRTLEQRAVQLERAVSGQANDYV